jgi:N-acetylglucosamine-6-sulfatase
VLHRFTGSYQTDVMTRRAEEIIARRAAAPQPFFLWVTYIAPHNGLPREPGDPPGTSTPVPAPRHKGAFAAEPGGAHYRQELEALLAVDEGVGRIVDALARSGELDDTLLLFTSDNGFMHGEHGIRTGKRVPYEPSIRVPLLMRGPGVPRGLRLGQLAANVDIAPTVLEVAGASGAWIPDGMSLWPYMRDPGLETGRDILLEGSARKRTGMPRFTGLRTRTHKLVERDTGARELYDLERDPGELHNLAGQPGEASLERSLANRLARLRTCAGPGCRPAVPVSLLLRPAGGGAGRLGGCHFAVSLGGRALPRVRGVRLLVDGRRAGRLRRPAYSAVLAGGATKVRARVRLSDDRLVTVDRALPLCG